MVGFVIKVPSIHFQGASSRFGSGLVEIQLPYDTTDMIHTEIEPYFNKMPAILALREMLGLIHLFQLYASPIDKTILANGIV